jgi:hypothetical protein
MLAANQMAIEDMAEAVGLASNLLQPKPLVHM